jgi:hypothetical protein
MVAFCCLRQRDIREPSGYLAYFPAGLTPSPDATMLHAAKRVRGTGIQ